MTIRRIPKDHDSFGFDDDLPVAKLYLDEIEQIVEILSDGNSGGKIRFRVGNQVCDTIEDLEKMGGSTRDFEVIAVTPNGPNSVRIKWSGAYLNLSGADDTSPIATEVTKVFSDNAIWWKNMARELMSHTRWWFVAALIAVLLAVAYFDPSESKAILLPDWHSLSATLLFFYIFLYRGTVVVLRYAHTGGFKKWAREYDSKIALLIAGAVIAEIVRDVAPAVKAYVLTIFPAKH
jgi:hypothetical protein